MKNLFTGLFTESLSSMQSYLVIAIVLVLVVLVTYVLSLVFKQDAKLLSTRDMTEIAIMVAFALVLEVLFTAFPGMAFGGRVSLSMLPIIIVSWRRGIVPGIIAGVLFGVLNMMLDGIASWALTIWVLLGAIFIDYLIAFGVVGLAGILRRVNNTMITFGAGILLAGTLRFLMHFLSGYIFWAAWAEEVYEGGMNPWLYSAIYNATYMVPTTLLLIVVGVLMFRRLNTIEN